MDDERFVVAASAIGGSFAALKLASAALNEFYPPKPADSLSPRWYAYSNYHANTLEKKAAIAAIAAWDTLGMCWLVNLALISKWNDSLLLGLAVLSSVDLVSSAFVVSPGFAALANLTIFGALVVTSFSQADLPQAWNVAFAVVSTIVIGVQLAMQRLLLSDELDKVVYGIHYENALETARTVPLLLNLAYFFLWTFVVQFHPVVVSASESLEVAKVSRLVVLGCCGCFLGSLGSFCCTILVPLPEKLGMALGVAFGLVLMAAVAALPIAFTRSRPLLWKAHRAEATSSLLCC